MKKQPILCSTCNNSKTKRNADGEITGYSCHGNSMQRAKKEKQCIAYSRDTQQTVLVGE